MEQKGSNYLTKLQSQQLVELLKSESEKDQKSLPSYQSLWRILVFDSYCQAILGTLFRTGNLRNMNITLHLNLNSNREQIKGVRIIYLVTPTKANIDKIIEDFQKDLYDSAQLHFIHAISDKLLQDLAKGIGKHRGLSQIVKVCQHSLFFVTLTPFLYSINMPELYRYFRMPSSSTVDLKEIYEKIGHSLFSLVFTISSKKSLFLNHPVVVYQNHSEHTKNIANQLNSVYSHLQEESASHLQEIQSNNGRLVQENSNYSSKTVILILDRDTDLGTLLYHPWLYGAMVHEIMGIRNNKIKINIEKQDVDVDLNTESDPFWAEHCNTPYPEIGQLLNDDLQKWQSDYQRITGKGGNIENAGNTEDLTSSLLNALDNVQEMTDIKKRIHNHLQMADQVKSQLKSRELDKYFEVGTAIYLNHTLNKDEQKSLEELLEVKDKGKDEDQLRILLLLALYSNMDASEFNQYEVKANLKNPDHLQILEKFQSKTQKDLKEDSNEEQQDDQIGGFLKGVASKIKTHGKGLMQNVTNYLPGSEQQGEVCNVAQNIFEGKFENQDNEYTITELGSKPSQSVRLTKNISNLVIFVAQGAGYNQYQQLCELSQKFNKPIFYGGAEMLNANHLFDQMSKVF